MFFDCVCVCVDGLTNVCLNILSCLSTTSVWLTDLLSAKMRMSVWRRDHAGGRTRLHHLLHQHHHHLPWFSEEFSSCDTPGNPGHIFPSAPSARLRYVWVTQRWGRKEAGSVALSSRFVVHTYKSTLVVFPSQRSAVLSHLHKASVQFHVKQQNRKHLHQKDAEEKGSDRQWWTQNERFTCSNSKCQKKFKIYWQQRSYFLFRKFLSGHVLIFMSNRENTIKYRLLHCCFM